MFIYVIIFLLILLISLSYYNPLDYDMITTNDLKKKDQEREIYHYHCTIMRGATLTRTLMTFRGQTHLRLLTLARLAISQNMWYQRSQSSSVLFVASSLSLRKHVSITRDLDPTR